MKIVIATDSYKGSNSAEQVCLAIKEGMQRILGEQEYHIVPIADGGEGTTDTVVRALGGEKRRCRVTDPLGRTVEAEWGMLPGQKAVLEMAAASGLPLVPENKRDPSLSTTYGTGELMKAALDAGCKEILLGIGGSATNDGGAGMAQALGISLKDKSGNEIKRGGAALLSLDSIDVSRMDPRIKDIKLITACDVTNPLCGPQGASATYGPQKGASPAMVKELDRALAHYAEIVERDLHVSIAELPGSGAAGGLGGGLVGLLGAELRPGIDAVLSMLDFSELVRDADLVITGEGKLDRQTPFGKVPAGVALWTKRAGEIPVIAIVGDIGDDFEAVYDVGIDAVISTVNRAMTLAEAMEKGRGLLVETGERVARLLTIGKRLAV
ncbi:glycerate kinase [Sediminispirochaeta smaragdinae]|uniref:Glycerate kinase n=1 Tax=Sediminispirochaeta smaragdinae (strain DSM 11293 / JCM 15392 / SEBR 4228) TaxID=573413 RepID=E1RAM1_SEDSS|nr:glycerate kinase [Sediminispirochaeta smaragdinae]ADK82389.1 glycerate kinase [Sediminispirochaeta smaragdinae DSM 11293]